MDDLTLMTVITDRHAYRKGYTIPFFRKPMHCPVHLVSWATDNDEIINFKCPICTDKISMELLMSKENFLWETYGGGKGE